MPLKKTILSFVDCVDDLCPFLSYAVSEYELSDTPPAFIYLCPSPPIFILHSLPLHPLTGESNTALSLLLRRWGHLANHRLLRSILLSHLTWDWVDNSQKVIRPALDCVSGDSPQSNLNRQREMVMDLTKASATSSSGDWMWVNLESPWDWDSLKHTSAVKN